jgi:hypothetical protein
MPAIPEGPYDLRVLLSELDARDTYATYHADKDKGIIRQYLPALWDVSAENNPEADESLLVDVLMDAMAITYLCERICITRAVDRIKIPGGRCRPCCVEPLALKMYDHVREY